MSSSKKCKTPASRQEVELLRQKIVDLLGRKPEKAAIILTQWINHSERKTPGKKSA